MSRPIDKGTTFVTGGDVSRFQRSSMPSKAPPAGAYAAPAAAAPGGGNAAPVYRGPSVRVTRGKDTTETPVSAKAAGGAILSSQSNGVRQTGKVLPAAGMTVIK
jgi:pilus assembly protein CpaB